jgi:G3E family GTPase
MNEKINTIPVQLLTGFLGSGKTTILNKIIQNPKMKGTLLIINEVGKIQIDSKLINSDNPVILLDSGCICCSLQEGLFQTLQFLLDQLNNQKLNFNKIIIESTGIADPASIINMIFQYMTTEITYKYAGTIGLLDGVNAKKEIQENYEAVKQIALSDKIIITKTDLIDIEDIEMLKDLALNLNPSAEIFTSDVNSSPIEAFLNYEIYNTPKNLKVIMDWLNTKRKDLNLASHIKQASSIKIGINTPIKPHSSYETISIRFNKPLSRISVINAYNTICSQYGIAVIRMKGIFDFGEGYPFVIHSVCGECYPITNLADWGDNPPFSEMVVICSPTIAANAKLILQETITTLEY